MSRLPRSHKRQHTQHVLSFLWFISGPRRVRVPCGRRPRVCAGNRSHPVHLTSLCSWTWPQSPAVPRAPRGQPCERSSRVFTGMPLGQTSGSGVSETRRCLHFLAVLPPPPPAVMERFVLRLPHQQRVSDIGVFSSGSRVRPELCGCGGTRILECRLNM